MLSPILASTAASPPTSDASPGGRLVCADGSALPLREAHLSATARGGLARVHLRQRFVNPHAEALALTYQLPLPHDAAVSGYAFELGDRRVHGVIESKEAARAQFEEALLDGHTAALLEEERASLFTQSLGNVPAGAEIVVELTLDQRLTWESPGTWAWRFPTVVAPRYAGAPGRVADAARVFVDVSERAAEVTCALTLDVGDGPAAADITSPSHAVRVHEREGGTRVVFANEEGVPLDRDVVVRWAAAHPETAVALETTGLMQLARSGADVNDGHAVRFGLLTLTPPLALRADEVLGRELVLLLDTSGSMNGEPLAQAKAVVLELVRGLNERDTLEMVEFSNTARRWRGGPVVMDAKARKQAVRFIEDLRANGGTEMVGGILEALAPRRGDAQRQVVLVTDGLIGFEHEVLAAAFAQLDPRTRIHVLGVGSAVNRSLTSPLARAGRGAEVIVGLGESPARAARTLCSRTHAPVCVDLRVEGAAARELGVRRIPDLFEGAPVLVPMSLGAAGGELVVRGRLAGGREWSQRLWVPAAEEASPDVRRDGALSALFAREAVEDLELARAVEPETTERLDACIEALGLRHAIATRRTSFVAVSEWRTVDPTLPSRRVKMPHALPHGLSIEGLGLRAASSAHAWQAQGFGRMPPAALTRGARPTAQGRSRPSAPASMGRAKGGGFAVFESVAEFFQRREAKVQREPGTPPDTVPAEPLHLASDDADAVRVEAHPRILRGWARHVGGRLVVEVTLDADFEWAGASNVTLRFRETTVEAEVEAAATTRAGTLTLGQVLRLVVRIPDGMSQIVDLVDLVDANGAWRIELEVPPSEARG